MISFNFLSLSLSSNLTLKVLLHICAPDCFHVRQYMLKVLAWCPTQGQYVSSCAHHSTWKPFCGVCVSVNTSHLVALYVPNHRHSDVLSHSSGAQTPRKCVELNLANNVNESGSWISPWLPGDRHLNFNLLRLAVDKDSKAFGPLSLLVFWSRLTFDSRGLFYSTAIPLLPALLHSTILLHRIVLRVSNPSPSMVS